MYMSVIGYAGQNVSTNFNETIQRVKQWCNLSHVLFNMYMDFMIMDCKNEITVIGVQTDKERNISNALFADDQVLITSK
jgi:hypothetical protein